MTSSDRKLRRKRISLLLILSQVLGMFDGVSDSSDLWPSAPVEMELTTKAFEVGNQVIKYIRGWRKLRYGELDSSDSEGMV